MKKIIFVIGLFTMAALVIGLTKSTNLKNNLIGSKPNIVYILADDFSYRDLSIYGQQQFTTPTLDALCEEGVRFTQAYSASPECAPARSCILTGRHTGHGRIRTNSSARGQDHLLDQDTTIAEILKDNGYATAFIGKWGIGQPQTEGVPYKQGFDLSFGYYDQVRAHTFYPHFLWENDKKHEYPSNSGFDMNKRYNNNIPNPPDELLNTYDENGKLYISELEDPYGGVYSENEFQKKALSFIDEKKDEPFFLYYATQLPHGPVIIDDLGKMKDRPEIPQKPREWAAMVQKLDDFANKLIKKLKSLNLYENTIIVFSSDNGYSMAGYMGRGNAPNWEDDPWLKNKGPFTGGKFSVLEGGCRIPFFIHWPDKFQKNISDIPVWLPDLFPTFAELAGAEDIPKNDGKSLLNILLNSEDDSIIDRPLYFSKGPEQAVRKGPWKAYRENPNSNLELYLVTEDTYTLSDVSANYPEVVKVMENLMISQHDTSQWYWNPWESAAEYRAKQEKAKDLGEDLPTIRPNDVKILPWEIN